MDPKKKIFFSVVLASAMGSAAWACNFMPQVVPAPEVKSAAITTSLTADKGAPTPEAGATEFAPASAVETKAAAPAAEAANQESNSPAGGEKCACACEKEQVGAQNAPASQPAPASGAAVNAEKGQPERARKNERTGTCPFRKTTGVQTPADTQTSAESNSGTNKNADGGTNTGATTETNTDAGSAADTDDTDAATGTGGGTTPGTAAGTTTGTGTNPDPNASFRQQFLALINAHRAANGKGALAYDALIDRAATNHSAWMQATGTFSHTGEGGSQFYQRCQAVGTSCDAENIAWGFTSAQMLFDMWKNSPGHNANMLGNHTVMGLGIVGRYATNDFR